MPYYGEALPYYYGGPFSNHSSLMTGTGRTLHSPLGSTRYAPHLTTISETPLSTLRRYTPASTTTSTITTHPRRVIDTADIDVSTPRALSSSRNENQRNRLRRDRPTIRIRSQALKDNPALREHNERHEKTVGELLVEKFLIKDKKPESEGEFKTKLYAQVSLENDYERKKREEMQEAIQKRVTRRMTRRRSSADVHIDPEQLKREVLIAQAQADALDSLVAEEQAEIEVETRMGTLIRKNLVRTPRMRHELENLSGEDQDETRTKKTAKKLKKRKKTTDKPSPPGEDEVELEDPERTKKVCKDNRKEMKEKLPTIDSIDKETEDKLETEKDSKIEEKTSRVVEKLPMMEDKSFPNIEDEFNLEGEGEISPRGLKFKIEASNSVGDFSTLWINARENEIQERKNVPGVVEQFRDSVRLPAPSKLGKTKRETNLEKNEDSSHDEIVILPVKRAYVKDETRNSVYLTLKAPKNVNNANKMAMTIGRTRGKIEESVTSEKKSVEVENANNLKKIPAIDRIRGKVEESAISKEKSVETEIGKNASKIPTIGKVRSKIEESTGNEKPIEVESANVSKIPKIGRTREKIEESAIGKEKSIEDKIGKTATKIPAIARIREKTEESALIGNEKSVEGESAREISTPGDAVSINRQAKINKVAKFRSKDNIESDTEVRSISVSIAGREETKDGGTKKLSGHVDDGSLIGANESIASENFGRDASAISQNIFPKIPVEEEKTKPLISSIVDERGKEENENKSEKIKKILKINDLETLKDLPSDKIEKAPAKKVEKLQDDKINQIPIEDENRQKVDDLPVEEKLGKLIKPVKKDTKETTRTDNSIIENLPVPEEVYEVKKEQEEKIDEISAAASPRSLLESLPNASTIAKTVTEEARVFGKKTKEEKEDSEIKSKENSKTSEKTDENRENRVEISGKSVETGIEKTDKKLKKKVTSDAPKKEKNAEPKLPKNRLLLGKIGKIEPVGSSTEVVTDHSKNHENREKECSLVTGDGVPKIEDFLADSPKEKKKIGTKIFEKSNKKDSKILPIEKTIPSVESEFVKKSESPSGKKEEEIDFWGEIESQKEVKTVRKDNHSASCISADQAEKKVRDSMVIVLESEPKACSESGPTRVADTSSEEKKLSKVKKKKKKTESEGSAGKKKDAESSEPTIFDSELDERSRQRSVDRLESKSESEPESASNLVIETIESPEIGKFERNLSTIIEENSPEVSKNENLDPLASILREQEKIESKLETDQVESAKIGKTEPSIEPEVTKITETINDTQNLESQVSKNLEQNTEPIKESKNLIPLELPVLPEIDEESSIPEKSDEILEKKVCTSVPEINIVAPSSPTKIDSPSTFEPEVIQEEDDDEPEAVRNETITDKKKNISKWQCMTDLSLDEPDKDIVPEVPLEIGKKGSGKKKIGSSKKTSKKSSTKSSGGQDSSKKKSKLGKKKKSLTKDGEKAVKKLEEISGSKISNSSDSTLTPGGPNKRNSPMNSGRNSPKQRPLDLIKMFYTTPASLLTATPRDLSKVRRAKIKKRKHSSRTASASSDSTGSTRSTQSTGTTESSGSNEHDEDPGHKRVSSTRSNDSGFDGSPRLSNCDMACHKKCEKLTGNLCGLNQKLVAEALQSLKRAPSQSSDNQRNSDGSDHHASGRITPPATNLPRFKKYTVSDFNFLKVLGKGSFGKVLLAELRRTDCVYAVKCLKKDVVLEDDDVECTLIERKVLTLATRHPYLCHLFCTFQTDSHLFFVMEYLNGGDLMFHIQKSGRFAEGRARFYAAEIWSGLNFLHKKGIVYRDLKLDNVLLDFEGHIRIADFGMCKLQIFLDRTADTFCGTPDYMAPEIIQGMKYNQAVDWWSFGVLLYEMLTGQSPFSGCDEDELFWSICNERPFIPRYLSQEAMDVLVCLLEKDAGKRPPAHEIAVHPFFHALQWDRLERRQLEPPFKPALEHTLDTRYFDTAFTAERPRLTPVPEQILTSMDQSVFRGFSYTNPNATD